MLSTIIRIIYRPIGICHTYSNVRKRKSDSHNRIFLLNIPSHGNLGDHLLSIAEQRFLADNFPEREIILVSSADLYFSSRIALMDVCEDDIICITGGGFMGSMYAEEERILKIIQRFPNNKIVFFPQTIYYAPTPQGDRMKNAAAKIYSSHKHLFVAARDSNTYNLLKNVLMPGDKQDIALLPDMALYIHFPSTNIRDGILWCMRKDTEVKSDNAAIVEKLRKIVADLPYSLKEADTYVNYSIPLEHEEEEVRRKIDEFSRARLVITDRLHGMLYAIITDTPVIALDNVSGKVGQVYKLWLHNCPLIHFIDDQNISSDAIQDLMTNAATFANEAIKEKYLPLIHAINEQL